MQEGIVTLAGYARIMARVTQASGLIPQIGVVVGNTEGIVNFNAGTLGASMVEGRISAVVVVGDGSDVGGTTIRWCCVNFYLEGAGPCCQLQTDHRDVP